MPIKNVEVNRKIWNFLESRRHKILIVYGGAGSGKSYTVAQWVIIRALEQHGAYFLVTRKHNPSLKVTTFALIRHLLDEWQIPYNIRIADQEITIGLSKIFFRGIDDPEKIKSAEFNYVWMEEATEFTREDFQQLRLRIRKHNNGRYRNQMILTFNPISMSHWIYEEFFINLPDDVAILHTTYKDNLKWLPPDYVKELESLKERDEYFYKVYSLGQFASRKGAIYDNWEVIMDEEADKVLEDAEEVFYGLDFGFNNPTALLKIVEKDKTIYIVDELYRRGLTNADLIELMKEFIKPEGVIYADSAEPARIEEIERHGFIILPAAKSVKDGIDYVKRYKIKVAKRCLNTIKELRNYKWKEDRNGRILDEPVKFMDHAMDALRYAVYTRAQQNGTVNVWWM